MTNKVDPTIGRVAFKGSALVEENDNVLPRAFFVDGYKVADGLQILNSLRDGTFDPGKTVCLENDPKLNVEVPDTTVYVRFLDYEIQSMKLQAKASGNNLLLLSEVYYPAGWNAFIDGKPAQIYKADYFLRAIVVPKGVHEIELRFEPKVYSIGKYLTLGTNILVGLPLLVLWIGSLLAMIQKRNNNAPPGVKTAEEKK